MLPQQRAVSVAGYQAHSQVESATSKLTADGLKYCEICHPDSGVSFQMSLSSHAIDFLCNIRSGRRKGRKTIL